MKLVEIAENFFDYRDKENQLQQVHSILFIYKVTIPTGNELLNKNNFSVLDKEKTKLVWVTKKEAKKMSILPSLAKRFLNSSKFSYDIIDDTTKDE